MLSPTSPDMRVTYLDATEHPGTVQEYKIMSTLYINGELAYTWGRQRHCPTKTGRVNSVQTRRSVR
jgi:hypothetical protein